MAAYMKVLDAAPPEVARVTKLGSRCEHYDTLRALKLGQCLSIDTAKPGAPKMTTLMGGAHAVARRAGMTVATVTAGTVVYITRTA